jgi:tetratricopeptide (TPR) repeat protein
MKPEADILPDALVSHYRLVSRLGAGGMGEVWVGVDETLRRRVAMKASRFLREARILSQLDHPNICRVYDYIEGERRAWLVMELIEGATLREAITAGMTPAQRLRTAQAIVSVLVAMHAAGVVHRDLKPTNVMLTTSGEPKVLDFGLSAVDSQRDDVSEPSRPRSVESTTPIDLGDAKFHTAAGGFIGTVAYMSPEQLAGDGATTASDMYAFGLVLEEMYTARAPSGGAPYPREIPKPPPVPKAIAALIARLTEKVPSRRPTAVDALRMLDAIADAPRLLRLRLAIAAVAIVMVGGAAKYTVDLARQRTEADQRRQQAESLIGFMVGDLRTRLTAVGRLDLLDEVGRKALDYFEAVPGSTLTGEELYRRSQTLQQLGQVRQARADMKAAQAAYEESLVLAQQVVNSDPSVAAWQVGLGASHFYVGDMKRRNGDLDGALEHFRKYQDIGRLLVERDPKNVEYKLELSYGHSNIAAILSAQRKFDDARRELERTRDIQTEIAKLKPDDRAIQTSRANNFNRLGVMLQRLGDYPGAVSSFESELAIYRQLASADPQNTQFKRRVPAAYQFLGSNLRALGEPQRALESFEAGVSAARELVARDPQNNDWQRLLGYSLLFAGRMRQLSGDRAAALADARQAHAAFAPAAAKNPGLTEQQNMLAQASASIADLLADEGQFAAASRECSAAFPILDGLYRAQPSDAQAARALTLLLIVRGRIKDSLHDRAGALEDWSRGVEILSPHVSDTDFVMIEPYVRTLALLGDVERAQAPVARLRALGYRDRDFWSFWDANVAGRR